MSNFDAFNQMHLARVLEPFLPGVTAHITPIKYQAITPDIFALLFRTSGRDGNSYYFVSLEFDYLRNLDEAMLIIREWIDSDVQEFLPPADHKGQAIDDLVSMRTISEKPYYAILAIVKRPANLGYWSDSVMLAPGDSVKEKLPNFSDKNIDFVQKFIGEHSEPKTTTPSTNTTKYTISAYKSRSGSIELFFK